MSNRELLTPDEADALLMGARPESSDADGTAEPFPPYDFRRPSNRLNARKAEIENVAERFSSDFEAQLLGLLRRPIEVTVMELSFSSYCDYRSSLPLGFSTYDLNIISRKEGGLFAMDPKLAFLIVDTFFGGNGNLSAAPTERDLSPIERRIAHRFLHKTAQILGRALAPVTKAEFQLRVGEVGAVHSGLEWLAFLRFRVSVESHSLEFHTGLPCALFDPFDIKKKVSETSWRAQLADRMKQAKVELTSVLAEAEIPMAKLLRLKPGDLISITMDETVPVYAEGIPLFRAAVCDSNGFASARIVEDLDTAN